MKPLATAAHSGGTITITREGIDSVDAHEVRHIPWHECLGAVWQPPQLTVTVHRDGVVQRHAWLLAEAGQVPEAVRDRITSTVIADVARQFGDHGAVRFIARRRGDFVVWLTLADDVSWAGSDDGSRAIAAEMSRLRADLGV